MACRAFEALAEKRLTKVCSSAICDLLLRVLGQQLFASHGGRCHVLVVVARIDAQLAVVQVGHVGADAVQEVSVVGDDHHRAVAGVQQLLDPADGVDVQVVGGLVEEQHVRVAEQRLCQQYAQFPAGRHLTHQAVIQLCRNTDTPQEFAGAGLGGVAVEFGEPGFQFADPHPVFLAHLRQGIDEVPFLLDGPEFGMPHDHGIDHRIFLEGELVLTQLAKAYPGIQGHVARSGGQIAAQDLHECGLTAAVGPDQPVAVAAAELGGDVLKQRLGAELHGDIGGRDQGEILLWGLIRGADATRHPAEIAH